MTDRWLIGMVLVGGFLFALWYRTQYQDEQKETKYPYVIGILLMWALTGWIYWPG